MKSFAVFIYVATIICVVLDLVAINVLLNPDRFKILIDLGIFKDSSKENLATLIKFILGISIASCVLLILSFILIIKKLLTNPYKGYKF